MSEKPVDLDAFILWLREVLPTMRYGRVGIEFIMRDGKIAVGRKVCEETWKTDLCS
jgi:hypothetical protein